MIIHDILPDSKPNLQKDCIFKKLLRNVCFLFLCSCKKTPPGCRNARPQSGICVFDQRNYSIFTAKASVVRSWASVVRCLSSSKNRSTSTSATYSTATLMGMLPESRGLSWAPHSSTISASLAPGESS